MLIDHRENVQFMKELKVRYPDIPIVCILNRECYMHMLSDVGGVHFIQPPITAAKVKRALAGLSALDNRFHGPATLVVSSKYGSTILSIKEILYCESLKRIVYFHTSENTYSMYAKLGDIEAALPEHFIRCHQSYLVNFHAVRTIEKSHIELVNGKRAPVSQRKRKRVMEKLASWRENIPVTAV
jgi:DNA-binding LytR/AlgR family response regulator